MSEECRTVNGFRSGCRLGVELRRRSTEAVRRKVCFGVLCGERRGVLALLLFLELLLPLDDVGGGQSCEVTTASWRRGVAVVRRGEQRCGELRRTGGGSGLRVACIAT